LSPGSAAIRTTRFHDARASQPVSTRIAARLSRPYRRLFGVPGVSSLTAAGFVAQLTQSAGPLGLLLVAQESTGSFSVAGAALAAFAVGAGVGRPLQGRRIDRLGPAHVLLVVGPVHGAALIAAALLASAGAGSWTLISAAAVAGLSLPAISASMRVLLAQTAPDHRDAAYAVITVSQEASLLLGPLILGAMVVVSAAAALVTVAVAAAAGTIWFAFSPPARSFEAATHPTADGSLLAAGMTIVLALAVLLGAALGAAEVGIPAFAIDHGHPGISGALVAALSAGGIVGGAVVGALPWAAPAVTRLTVLIFLLAAGLLALAVAPSLAAIAVMLAVAGLPLTPAIINLAFLVDDHAPRPASAHAFGWLSTSLAAGAGLGSGIAGVLAEHVSTDSVFAQAGATAAIGGIVCLATRRWLLRSEDWPRAKLAAECSSTHSPS
jgi:MFS family permease